MDRNARAVREGDHADVGDDREMERKVDAGGGEKASRVLNAKRVGKNPAPDRVYVGRPSKWGNPFVIGRDGTRDDVISKYRSWVTRQASLLGSLHELRGKNLVCWCSPEACHADVLLKLANR